MTALWHERLSATGRLSPFARWDRSGESPARRCKEFLQCLAGRCGSLIPRRSVAPYTSVRSEISRASSTLTPSPAASAVVIFSLMSNGQDSYLGLVVDLKEGYVSCGPEGDHKLT